MYFWPKKGQFWIFDKKMKQTFFYIYKAKASWEKSEKSDVSLWKYEQKKHWFLAILAKNGQFWTVFGQKRANFEFSAKKWTGHFFTFIKPGLHEKNQKNLMHHFGIMSKKHRFWTILTNFGPFLTKKGPILNFRPKSDSVTFLRL